MIRSILTSIAGTSGQRMPSPNELDGARFQGKHVAINREHAQRLNSALPWPAISATQILN